MSSGEKEKSNVVYYISSSPTPTTIIIIVIILLIIMGAFALSVTCYCYTCRIQKPNYSRLMNGLIPHCSPNVSLPNTPTLHHQSSPPLLRTSSDRVISSHRLSVSFRLRRALSLDEMVSIELPDSGVCDTDRGVSHDISPDSLSSDSVESGHGRVDSRDSVESGLERVDSRYSVGSGLGRSGETSTNHILLNCERDVGVIRSKGSSPINDEVIIHNERSLTPPFSSSSSSSLYLKLVKYKEKPQSLEHYDTPRKRVDSRRTRVLPKNQLEWSDEATDDEGKRRMRDLYRGLPRIVPPHLQARDIEWTDDTDLDIKEDEVLPHDSEIVMTSEKNILSLNQESPVIRNFVDSSDDEYHSTHSDISVEDLSKLSSEHTNMSSHIDMPRQASGTTVLENSEDIIFISDIKANGDVNLPIEELKPSENIKPMELVKSDSSSSSKSGNLASNSLTIPTKHLVL